MFVPDRARPPRVADQLTVSATIKALYRASGFVDDVTAVSGAPELVGVVLDQTNFYAEQGTRPHPASVPQLARC